MTDPRSGADILALHRGEDDKPRKRTGVAHICMRPDLIDEWQDAQDHLVQCKVEDEGKGRLGQGGTSAKTRKAAERVQELEQQIEDADVAFTFEKLGKTRVSEIQDENPPRDGNMLDYSVGYNREAVDNTVVYESLVDPVFDRCSKKACKHDACGSWEALLKILGPGEWEELTSVVRELSGAVSAPPKSDLASRVLARRASGSGQRERGA
jgi:hypothetical protein